VIGFKTAKPQPGYGFELHSEGPREVKVEFKALDEDLSSEITATCEDGEIDPKVHEEN
jgi:hypothetical protein